MDSQKTTHILLVIIAVGIFFIIYLFMKERYFARPQIQPVVWEETVPAKPWTNTVVTPTPNPVANPNPAPTTSPVPSPAVSVIVVPDVELSTGDMTVVGYAEDSNQVLYALCHQDETTWTFNRYGMQGCGMAAELILNKRKVSLLLKTPEDKEKMDVLNARYSITAIQKSNNMYELTIPNNSPYNSLEISKAYFSTGYFMNIRPMEAN